VSPIDESDDGLADVRSSAAMAELQDIRDSIDNIDASIIHMLAERFRCTQKVGVLKARHNLPPADPGAKIRIAGIYSALICILNFETQLDDSALTCSCQTPVHQQLTKSISMETT
jgi:monofunctional chorismate mutase